MKLETLLIQLEATGLIKCLNSDGRVWDEHFGQLREKHGEEITLSLELTPPLEV